MKKLMFFLMMAGAVVTGRAQERPEHEIHAAMLFNFIKYVQWPDEGTAGDFVIGVMGEDNVFNTLKNWYDGKPKGSKKFVIKKITTSDEAATCQVVYLGKSKSKEFENIKNAIAGKPVLTVTDGSGLGQKGSCINFRVIDGKLKWELNQATFSSSNLKVSGQLASMSILI